MDMVTDGAEGPERDPGQDPGAVADEAALARAALARVLAAEEFVSSPRLADFLRFVVEAKLAGRADEIKGYTIAVEALGRPTSFDPQSDPIVRVEATRLRRALERYYSTVGPEETLEIVIPKGSYVPQFRPRGDAVEPAPEPELLPAALPVMLPPAPPAPRRLVARGAVVALLLLLGAGLGWTSLRYGVDTADTLGRALGLAHEGPRDLADRLGMPVLDVRPFETVGSRAPTLAETHAIEARLRDAFARFDFVDVMEPGQEASVRECRDPPPRSVFALSGLAEGRDDGSFSLLVRLVDRCEGTIVWSSAFESLRRGADMPATEQRLVRDISVALMQSYGVLPTRARAQARADETPSGFGCIARLHALSRAVEPQSAASAVQDCLAQAAGQHSGFVLAHAVRAQLMLDEMLRNPESPPDTDRDQKMLREAELAADLLPTSAYAARVLAKVDFSRGEREAAMAAVERVRTLNPLDYDATADMGTVLIGLGQPEQGEALLTYARAHGALRTPLQEAYLAISAFMREDAHAAGSVVTPLQLHPTPQTRVALALALHTLGRADEEREVVQALTRDTPGGAAGVRRVVHTLLPFSSVAEPALDELEKAGLTPRAMTGIQQRG
ncbi:hypothetical protein GCM10007301_39130 [Azorhizobium oxalatiphilum]|uniref:Adenylate cyclase n=1 Tax=Azorhizobium oxalatiphilum TaxID=980631 RepID=A0A917FH28_9HYPH|nr:hypothetical protein [Azorhizobium oxalatiphilum]GGF75405.1 hypothetical protein GCM10007301_39130 [Azorhizobium oxalatiphilum]